MLRNSFTAKMGTTCSWATAATARALAYAAERIQGGNMAAPGTAIIEHPDIRRMLLTMKALTGGVRGIAHRGTLETCPASGPYSLSAWTRMPSRSS